MDSIQYSSNQRKTVADAVFKLDDLHRKLHGKIEESKYPTEVAHLVLQPVREIKDAITVDRNGKIDVEKSISEFTRFLGVIERERPEVYNMIEAAAQKASYLKLTPDGLWDYFTIFPDVQKEAIRNIRHRKTQSASKKILVGIVALETALAGAYLGSLEYLGSFNDVREFINTELIIDEFDFGRIYLDESETNCGRYPISFGVTKIGNEIKETITGEDMDDDCVPESVEKLHGTDPHNPDSDGDGLKDNWELFGPYRDITNPLKPTLLIEIDKHNNGIRTAGDIPINLLKNLKRIFGDNGIDLFVDLKLEGNQILNPAPDGRKCDYNYKEYDEFMKMAENATFMKNDRDRCIIAAFMSDDFKYYSSMWLYGRQIGTPSLIESGNMTFDTVDNAFNNTKWFNQTRKGKFHYGVVTPEFRNATIGGEASLPGSKFAIELNDTLPMSTLINIFLHELGHNFGLTHVDNSSDVMNPFAYGVWDYTPDQWKHIKSKGLRESLDKKEGILSSKQ